MRYPRICEAGDQALLVEFGETYSKEVSCAVMAFDRLLNHSQPPLEGIVETAPTLRSVLIQFDSTKRDPQHIENWCRAALEGKNWYREKTPVTGQNWRIPVIYGGEGGPDLTEVAGLVGLTESQVIESHSSADLTVLCLGFSPGLAYLAELPETFAIPRRNAYTARPVPAGSILIANQQTVLPATPIQTGWWRIGMTPVMTFRPEKAKPFLLSPGDSVRFQPITEAEANDSRLDTLWEALDHDRA